MYSVDFEAGESRSIIRDGKLVGVDYMLVVVETPDGEEVELYAERDTTDIWEHGKETQEGHYKEGYDEYTFYEELKADILEQAAEVGISPDELEFYAD